MIKTIKGTSSAPTQCQVYTHDTIHISARRTRRLLRANSTNLTNIPAFVAAGAALLPIKRICSAIFELYNCKANKEVAMGNEKKLTKQSHKYFILCSLKTIRVLFGLHALQNGSINHYNIGTYPYSIAVHLRFMPGKLYEGKMQYIAIYK